MDWKKPLENMRAELKDYIVKSNLKSLVLGVSGGIDSALVAAIARPVCDEVGIRLIGRSLPASSNKPDEISRAEMVGNAFCHDFDTVHINDRVANTLSAVERGYSLHEDEKFNKIAEGNVKARTRMIHLYDLAYRTRGMVMSTDNRDELCVGFFTIHGDQGDFGLIQYLWKTEVYDLSNWICFNELNSEDSISQPKFEALQVCVDAVPTDGLGISTSDMDQLGASSYMEVGIILKTWLTEDEDSFAWDDDLKYSGRKEDYKDFMLYRDTLKEHPVIQRYIKTEFKRTGTINLTRSQIFKEEWVEKGDLDKTCKFCFTCGHGFCADDGGG